MTVTRVLIHSARVTAPPAKMVSYAEVSIPLGTTTKPPASAIVSREERLVTRITQNGKSTPSTSRPSSSALPA